MRAVNPKWSDERAVAAMVFSWLDAEDYEDAGIDAQLDVPVMGLSPLRHQLVALLRSGQPLSASMHNVIAEHLESLGVASKPAQRKRGRPKTDSLLPDAEILCLRISGFLKQHYPGERGIRQRAIHLTVERLKLYDIKLRARTLQNYMARPAGNRRRR